MNIEDFNYELPGNLIAQYPPENRGDSKLLLANPSTQTLKDLTFKSFLGLVGPNDLIIFNNTRVIKARLYGQKETGGKVEILIEQILDNQKALAFLVQGNGCPVARNAAPRFQELKDFYSDQEVEFFMLNFPAFSVKNHQF